MRVTASLLVLAISCVVLLTRTSYAAQANEAKLQQNAKASEPHPGHAQASAKNQPRWAAKANRPQQLKKNRELTATGNSSALRQQSSNKAVDAANAALSGPEAVNPTRAGRHPTVPQPSVPGPRTVSHRGPNPATVGGAADLSSKSTGAINGTRVNRKH